jgi:hypothetical protein
LYESEIKELEAFLGSSYFISNLRSSA